MSKRNEQHTYYYILFSNSISCNFIKYIFTIYSQRYIYKYFVNYYTVGVSNEKIQFRLNEKNTYIKMPHDISMTFLPTKKHCFFQEMVL